MDWRIWPSSVLTLNECGAACFSTTMAGLHVHSCWMVTWTPIWSGGRALVHRSRYLFCLCCLASKDLCTPWAAFGDNRLVAVGSLSFNIRLISNCAVEYSRPDIGVFLYAKRANSISRPSSATFLINCFIVLTDPSLCLLDRAWWGLDVLTLKPRYSANLANSLLPNGMLRAMTGSAIPSLAKQVFRCEITPLAVFVYN